MTSLTPFISTSDLSDYLGRDVTADDGATIAVDAACDMVRTFAEQDFNAGTATVSLDGTGTDSLLLSRLPVTGVTSVSVGGTANGGTVSGGSAITDYALRNDGVLLRTAGAAVWPDGRQNISVTYTNGYGSAVLPRDVRMVALQIASRLIVQGVAVSESVGGVSISYAGPAMDLSTTERQILRKYRR